MKKRRGESKGSESEKPDIPSKPWYKNIMAILALVSALVVAVTGLIALIQRLEPTKVAQNTIIIFDRSTAMNGPFERSTKLQAAIETVDEVLSSEVAGADNLALRQFGGPCTGENTQMVVGFGQHNEGRVRDTVRNLQAGGETTLTDAIIEAIGDFNDPKRFEGVNKRIIVVTGGGDSCQADPAKYIRNRLETLGTGEGVTVSFRFIGMALNPEQQSQLRAIAEETRGLSEDKVEDQLFFVSSQDEFAEVLSEIVEVEPVLNTVTGMADIMNNVTQHLNTGANAINREDYPAAEEGLRAASSELNNTQPLLEDLGQRLSAQQFQEQFQELYGLVTANRDLQEEQLKMLETMISQGKSDDTDALNKTIQAWNEIISTFNSNVREVDTIIADIVSKLRERRAP